MPSTGGKRRKPETILRELVQAVRRADAAGLLELLAGEWDREFGCKSAVGDQAREASKAVRALLRELRRVVRP